VFDTLVAGGVAVWHLQRVAAKKRDPLSHVLFLDELVAGEAGGAVAQLPSAKYWCAAMRAQLGQRLQCWSPFGCRLFTFKSSPG
jgi:hypothetical protein